MIKVGGGGASSEWQECLSRDEWNRNLKGTSETNQPHNRVAEINMRINIFAIVVLTAVLASAPLANAAGASEVQPPSLPCLRFSTTTHPSYFVRNCILRPGICLTHLVAAAGPIAIPSSCRPARFIRSIISNFAARRRSGRHR
jgi:hypothetical protein